MFQKYRFLTVNIKSVFSTSPLFSLILLIPLFLYLIWPEVMTILLIFSKNQLFFHSLYCCLHFIDFSHDELDIHVITLPQGSKAILKERAKRLQVQNSGVHQRESMSSGYAECCSHDTQHLWFPAQFHASQESRMQ